MGDLLASISAIFTSSSSASVSSSAANFFIRSLDRCALRVPARLGAGILFDITTNSLCGIAYVYRLRRCGVAHF